MKFSNTGTDAKENKYKGLNQKFSSTALLCEFNISGLDCKRTP